MKRTAIVLVLALAACDLYPRHGAEEAVRDVLTDPESAQFSDWTIAGNGLLACGKVNARNRMGGYVGKRTFVVWGDAPARIASDEVEDIRFETCCMILERAVNSRIDSKDLDGFDRACDGVVRDGFSW